MNMKIDENGGYSEKLKKNKIRKMLEPFKIEKSKIFPMITILDSDGEINWKFL